MLHHRMYKKHHIIFFPALNLPFQSSKKKCALFYMKSFYLQHSPVVYDKYHDKDELNRMKKVLIDDLSRGWRGWLL